MKITKTEIVPIFVIVIMCIFALSLYNAPCITSGKTFGALVLPILTIAVYLLMLFLPKVRRYYFIRLFLVLFMTGIFFFRIIGLFKN